MKPVSTLIKTSLLAVCMAGLVSFGCKNPVDGEGFGQAQVTATKAMSVNPAISGFVTRQGDKLIENGQVLRFNSINIPNLHIVEDSDWKGNPAWHRITEFEQRDAFQTLVELGARVTRTYTFTVKGGKNNGNGLSHYYGPNNYDEDLFKDFDRTLALANEYGVRLIIPIIDEWDWVGGRVQFAALNGGGDFYSNGNVKQAFKNWISYILNRTNTITGIKYKDDKAILAWETGNELQNTPTAWTDEIARHIKSEDPNHLVMDGVSYPVTESINSGVIDMVSSHYYKHDGADYLQRTKNDVAKTRGKKVFIIGEFGLTDPAMIKSVLDYVTSDTSIAGSMLWSLRYHAENGGFYWHDDQGQMAYHWPGFDSNSVSNEKQVLANLRTASFAIRGLSEPSRAKPATPPVLIQNGNSFAWKGSVGAEYYEMERALSASGPWSVVATKLSDADRPFKPWTDNTAQAGINYVYRIKAVNIAGSNPDWSNENQAPIVSAGTNISTVTPNVALNGSVSDDGKPLPANLSTSWTQLSGPSTVVFANPSDPKTSVTLGSKGDYVLQLSATDGLLTSKASVQISYGSVPVVKKYEAEVATYTGLNLKPDGSASGSAYLEFRDSGSVEWNVLAPSAGKVELAFGYRSAFGPKQQTLSINGVAAGTVDFAQSSNFTEVKLSLPLNQGANKVVLSKSWGWMDIDYLKVTTSEITQTPPAVAITSPKNGDSFDTSAIVVVGATATDADGTVTKVEFYLDGTLVATDTLNPYQASIQMPSVAKTSVITARAFDNDGLSSEQSVNITLGQTPPSDLVSVVYTKNDWGGGFSANISITNKGTVPVNGWALKFSFNGNQTITNGWSGTYSQVGKSVNVTNVDYNALIAPGATISIGFNANYSGSNPDPSDFVFTKK